MSWSSISFNNLPALTKLRASERVKVMMSINFFQLFLAVESTNHHLLASSGDSGSTSLNTNNSKAHLFLNPSRGEVDDLMF